MIQYIYTLYHYQFKKFMLFAISDIYLLFVLRTLEILLSSFVEFYHHCTTINYLAVICIY